MEETNRTANALFLVGVVVIIIGFAVGLLTDSSLQEGKFDYIHELTWWGSGVIAGSVLIGFSEIINLLHQLRNRIVSKETPEVVGIRANSADTISGHNA